MDALVLYAMGFGCGDSKLVAEISGSFFVNERQRMISEQQKVDYNCFFFMHCRVMFPCKQIPSLVEHCHVMFPCKEILSFFGHRTDLFLFIDVNFFGKLVQKWYYFNFQILFPRKSLNNQTAAVMLQVLPSSQANYSKISLILSANTYEKFIVSKDYCIAHHDDKMCFLPTLRNHLLLVGDTEE